MIKSLYTYNEITPELITTLYLYGSDTTPTDLLNEWLIRKPDTQGQKFNLNQTFIHVDMPSVMSTGHGRYAYGATSALVSGFFEGNYAAFAPSTQDKIFSKDAVMSIMGFSTTGDDKSYNVSVQNYDYDSNSADFAARAYTWGSTGFKISDAAEWVVHPDGKKEIKNYAVHAFNDDFNLVSGNPLTQFLDDRFVRGWVDPSGLGRTVGIIMDNKEQVPVLPSYTIANYELEKDLYDVYHDITQKFVTLYPLTTDITDNFFETGITRFLTSDDKPIIYGTDTGEKLTEAVLWTEITSDGISYTIPNANKYPYLADYVSNGVALIGGKGNDTLTGGTAADILLGGADNDKVAGGSGSDTVEGGDGADVLWGGAGNIKTSSGATYSAADIGVNDSAKDTINGGAGNDILYAGVNDLADGGADNDVMYVAGGVGLGGSGGDTLRGLIGAEHLAANDNARKLQKYA